MINQKQQARRYRNSGKSWPLILFILIPLALPQRICASELRPPLQIPTLSQPCAPNDQSEICRLTRAVVAAQDEIETLKRRLTAATEAVEQLNKTVEAANAAIAAGAKERAAYEQTLAVAEKAIAQQQELIATYQGAIKTLQELVKMALERIDKLEGKLDSANKRAAWLGILSLIGAIIAATR